MERLLTKTLIERLTSECDPVRRAFLFDALVLVLRQIHYNDQVDALVQRALSLGLDVGVDLGEGEF
jgi:hypothetical protein